MTGQDRISYICKKVPEFVELYNAKVRHYTIKAHTINVFNQFEIYFSNKFSEINLELYRLILILHDIGKPTAHKNGNRKDRKSVV